MLHRLALCQMPCQMVSEKTPWRLPDDLMGKKQPAVPTKDFILGAIALTLVENSQEEKSGARRCQ